MSTENTIRTGLIAEKVGMTQIFTEDGEVIPVTLLKASGNFVLDTKTKQTNGYNAVVMAYGDVKPSRIAKPQRGKFAKANITPKKHVKEFRVSENALLSQGVELSIEHFVVDQAIDIQGVSIGKGFAGAMKRHNFRGLEATHGVSVSHRSHGSTGQRQDPGRVFKGKKMAGHLGTETLTIQNILIKRIDAELGIIAINGSVPGKNGSIVYISDATKQILPDNVQVPAVLVSTKVEVKKDEQHAEEKTN